MPSVETDYDVIVAGLGAMGSATACHLAAAGKRVLGLDRFRPPHNLGSSHGLSRIIREAYFEHPLYVPLVRRAYELWSDLERQSDQRLLLKTGGLMIGTPESVLVTGARRSAMEHGLPHEMLTAGQLKDRFPAVKPDPEMVAVWEPRAGILFPEKAIQAHLDLAMGAGARFGFDEPVVRWEPRAGGVVVHTVKASYSATHLVLTVGAWLSELIPDLAVPLAIERQVLFWFEPCSRPEIFSPEQCPIHLWQYGPGNFFYGFPDLGDGVKIAVHHEGQSVSPDTVRRDVDDEEKAGIRALAGRFVPEANGEMKSAAVCLYTNTPDEHFILDYHPDCAQVILASPCSGHGFKFSPVIGEIIAGMIGGEAARFDLGLFKIDRFISGRR